MTAKVYYEADADPSISLPFGDAVAMSPWGLPTAVPEALLAFKARDLRRRRRIR